MLEEGTFTLSNVTSHCLSAAIVLSTSNLMPGDFESTMKSVMPSSPEPPVRAATIMWSETCAS